MNKNEIVIELSESDRTKLGKEEFESESLNQRVFSAVWRVEAEVNRAAEFSEEITERLEFLDQGFFAYPHDLRDLLFAYVSKHPDEFGSLPQPDNE